jgi:hypothetical protein
MRRSNAEGKLQIPESGPVSSQLKLKLHHQPVWISPIRLGLRG